MAGKGTSCYKTSEGHQEPAGLLTAEPQLAYGLEQGGAQKTYGPSMLLHGNAKLWNTVDLWPGTEKFQGHRKLEAELDGKGTLHRLLGAYISSLWDVGFHLPNHPETTNLTGERSPALAVLAPVSTKDSPSS